MDRLTLRTRLHKLQISAISKTVSHAMTSLDRGTLESLITIFDAEANMYHAHSHDNTGLPHLTATRALCHSYGQNADQSPDNLMVYCVRLHICVTCLSFVNEQINRVRLIELYGIAIGMVEMFSSLDASMDFALFSTYYFARSLGLAAFVILKLTRCTWNLLIDRERGERCYFSAIRLLRRRSSDSPDLDSKLAMILTELWSSRSVFRDSSGNVESLRVRVRSRLVSSGSEKNL